MAVIVKKDEVILITGYTDYRGSPYITMHKLERKVRHMLGITKREANVLP